VALISGTSATDAHGQTISGRVVSEGTGTPAPTALVRLLDRDENVLDAVLADSLGTFRLRLPDPGEFFIDAQHLAYDYFRSPLLSAGDPGGAFAFDLELRPVPIELEGITVTATASSVNRWTTSRLGRDVASLRHPPIVGPPIERARLRNDTVSQLLRNNPPAGLVVMTTSHGTPCYMVRGRGCLPVYLDGFRMARGMAETLPMDMIASVILLDSNEAFLLPGNPSRAVLVLTRASVRADR
jgi:hypothetical protein